MAVITKPNTFTAGATIVASEHNDNFDTIYNEFNGSISNANVDSSAAIANSKLNLASISQAVTFTNDVTLGAGASDSVTINADDGITYTPAATWTFTGAQTVSGTWTDLGSVTTVDINGGTLDGVNIGGTTATGELIVNDSSDDANGLGDQGTSGEFLQSAGAGSNPVWASVTSPAIEFVSKTAITTTTGNIAITQGIAYMIWFQFDNTSGSQSTLQLEFNADSGQTYGNLGENAAISNEIDLPTMDNSSTLSAMIGQFMITPTRTDQMLINGDAVVYGASDTYNKVDIGGHWDNSATVTSFRILSSETISGDVILYKLNEA